MNNVELIIESEDSPSEIGNLSAFAQGILVRLEIDNWQMGLMITDDQGIREYNKQWRNKDLPTDVLSFVQDDGEVIPTVPGVPKEAGDIIISLETVARNAELWSGSYDEELRRVVIHGILHLNGMDHPGDDYETGMLKLQEELLAETGRLMKDNT